MDSSHAVVSKGDFIPYFAPSLGKRETSVLYENIFRTDDHKQDFQRAQLICLCYKNNE